MNKIQLIIFFVSMFLVIILAINSREDLSKNAKTSPSSNTTTSNSKELDDNVVVGQYSCTSYHSGQAGKLNPSTYEKNRLDTEEAELTRLNNEIDNTSVDEYSEYSVNSYNQKIRNYKTKLQKFNDEIGDYNSRVEIYNNYLTTNCKKRY